MDRKPNMRCSCARMLSSRSSAESRTLSTPYRNRGLMKNCCSIAFM